MEIKTPKQQLQERKDHIERLIDWQDIALQRAERRYRIKTDWVFSFWILTSSDTLNYIRKREQEIHDSLWEYYRTLEERLIEYGRGEN